MIEAMAKPAKQPNRPHFIEQWAARRTVSMAELARARCGQEPRHPLVQGLLADQAVSGEARGIFRLLDRGAIPRSRRRLDSGRTSRTDTGRTRSHTRDAGGRLPN